MLEALGFFALMEAAGLAAAPLAALVLGRLPGAGLGFAKVLGVLLVGWLAWMAASIGLADYGPLSIVAAFAVVAAMGALAGWRLRQLGRRLRAGGEEPPRGRFARWRRSRLAAQALPADDPVRLRLWAGSEAVFAVAFAVMALLIAFASLLAVAFKLDRTQHFVTVAAPAAAVPARAAAPPLARNVDVTLAQFAVTPSDTAAAAGKVTFRVHNAGTIVHEFVVIRTPRPAADLPLRDGRADESGNVGETGDLRPGTTKSVTLKLSTGHYALICNLPGHYVAGQHTDFAVR